jgi:hypothetical protein
MRDWITHHILELFLVLCLLLIGTWAYTYYVNQKTQHCTTQLSNVNRTQILNFLVATQRLQTSATKLEARGVATTSPQFQAYRTAYVISLNNFENELRQTASCP